jgi:hypothetical protein
MMREDFKFTIDLGDDCEQIDNLVRLRLIQVIEDIEYLGDTDDPELCKALVKVLQTFSTPDQWQIYVAKSS